MKRSMQKSLFAADEVMPNFGDQNAEPGTISYAVHIRDSAGASLNKHRIDRKAVKIYTTILLKDDLYKKLQWTEGRGKPWRRFTSWRHFCESPAPYGLGRSPDEIDELIQESKTARAQDEKDRRETQGPGNPTGNNQYTEERGNHTNSMISSESQTTAMQGTTRQYEIRRLRKAAERDPTTYLPTYQQVLNGDLKPHTALKLVGLVKDPTLLEQAQKAVLRLSAADQEAFREWYGTQQTG